MYSTAGRFSLFSLSDIAGMTLSADVMCRSLSNQIENNNYHYPTNCHWHFVKYMWHMLSDVYISTSIYAPTIILSFMSLYVLGVLTLIVPWGLLELFLILADSQLGDNTFSYSAAIWAIPLYEKKNTLKWSFRRESPSTDQHCMQMGQKLNYIKYIFVFGYMS